MRWMCISGWRDFFYYILATMLPVDKIIGRIYPLFALALLFMAVGILDYALSEKSGLARNMGGVRTEIREESDFPNDVYFHSLWSYQRVSCYPVAFDGALHNE